MARELEKTQDFLVVSEMITHLISSGKISDSMQKPLTIKWDNAQIELWINNMFKNAETVAEAAAIVVDPLTVASTEKAGTDVEAAATESIAKENVSTEPQAIASDMPTEQVKLDSQDKTDPANPTQPAVETAKDADATVITGAESSSAEDTAKLGEVAPVEDAAKAADSTIEATGSVAETVEESKLGEVAAATTDQVGNANTEIPSGQASGTEQESAGPAQSQESGIEEALEETELVYPAKLQILEGDEPYKELYVTSGKAGKQMFWQGVANIVTRSLAEGKVQKDITHTIADKIKALGKNDNFTQCFVRNFKKSPINEIYNTINKIAVTLGVKGWVDVK